MKHMGYTRLVFATVHNVHSAEGSIRICSPCSRDSERSLSIRRPCSAASLAAAGSVCSCSGGGRVTELKRCPAWRQPGWLVVKILEGARLGGLLSRSAHHSSPRPQETRSLPAAAAIADVVLCLCYAVRGGGFEFFSKNVKRHFCEAHAGLSQGEGSDGVGGGGKRASTHEITRYTPRILSVRRWHPE